MTKINNNEEIDANKLLQMQVHRLLQALESDTLVLEEALAETSEALKEIKLDKRGLPLLHTVPDRVRSLARIMAMRMAAQQQEQDDELAASSPMRDFLPDRTEVTEEVLDRCARDNRFFPLAFNLFAEVMTLATACALLAQMSNQELERNQAICAGSLVRISKFMRAMLTLAEDNQHGEIIYTLHRPIVESAITVRYLIAKDDPKFYDQFVEFSLGPEREVFDQVQDNINARGGVVLPIEQSMLNSINTTAEKSGVKIEDVSREDKNWGGNVRNRLQALGEPQLYGGFYRLPSHGIHGTWVDLIMRHLNYEDGKFTVNLKSPGADVRNLLPLALLILTTVFEYLQAFYDGHPQVRPLFDAIEDLYSRIQTADAAHQAWREARRAEPTA